MNQSNKTCIQILEQHRYRLKYWPMIEHAVRQILHNPDKIDFSQEELCRYFCSFHFPQIVVIYVNAQGNL